MLQAHKLVKLEEVEVKVEEEPEVKIIVGSGGEVLKPPGEGTISTYINSLLCLSVF